MPRLPWQVFLWPISIPKHTPNQPRLSHAISQSQTSWIKTIFSKQFISSVKFPASKGWNEPHDFHAKQFLKTEILLQTVPIYFPLDSNHFSPTKRGFEQHHLVLCPLLHDLGPLLNSELVCELEVLESLSKNAWITAQDRFIIVYIHEAWDCRARGYFFFLKKEPWIIEWTRRSTENPLLLMQFKLEDYHIVITGLSISAVLIQHL